VTVPGACVEALRSPELDLRRVVLLETAPPAGLDSAATGTARITSFGANHLEVEATASAPALLVLAEAYHPDWRATVGGTAQPVLAADCALRAVPVPAGTSRVVLQFTAPALRAGLAVSGVSGAVVLALLGFEMVRRRRAATPAAAGAEPAAREGAAR
jgi:hypothetical protein